jgi:rhodanese-related sulfurtransferase
MLKKISSSQLDTLLSSKRNYKILDLLPREQARHDYIPGAVSFPENMIEEYAPEFLEKNDFIIVHSADNDNQAIELAADKLLAMGYKNIVEWEGKIADYRSVHAF